MFSPLPNNEKTFHIKVQGERSKEWFEGDFTVKCLLNQAEQIDVALKTDRYNGGSASLPAQYALMNRTIAELEVRVKKGPTWWQESQSGRFLYDTNIVLEVFKESFKAEEAWGKAVEEQAAKAEKAVETK
jgi:hypothetical protein